MSRVGRLIGPSFPSRPSATAPPATANRRATAHPAIEKSHIPRRDGECRQLAIRFEKSPGVEGRGAGVGVCGCLHGIVWEQPQRKIGDRSQEMRIPPRAQRHSRKYISMTRPIRARPPLRYGSANCIAPALSPPMKWPDPLSSFRKIAPLKVCVGSFSVGGIFPRKSPVAGE